MSSGSSGTDVLVVGGGIAGVSIGYELAATHSVTLLEMEPTLAFHTTGRSAATYLETYGNDTVRALTRATRRALTEPSDIFHSALTHPLPLLWIADGAGLDTLHALHAEVHTLAPDARLVTGSDAEAMNPLLRPGHTAGAMIEPGSLEVDVHELHQGYTRGLRARGGTVLTSSGVVAARHDGSAWTLTDRAGTDHRARIVVNAAGAWADAVGGLLGAGSIGLQPLRRSVFILRCDEPTAGLPITIDVTDAFYVKPEAAGVLCSPSDQTPQPPSDAKPDELEIARALDAIAEATVLDTRHVTHSWAGLRSFVADKTPVVGYDPAVPGLFWFAGQGGYGIQLSDALARSGAALVREEPLPSDIAAQGVDAAALSPARFTEST